MLAHYINPECAQFWMAAVVTLVAITVSILGMAGVLKDLGCFPQCTLSACLGFWMQAPRIGGRH